MKILTPDDLLKLKRVPKWSFKDDGYQASELAQNEFYQYYFPDDIRLAENGPQFHHLRMYWLDNSLKPLVAREIAELMPDYIPVYYTALSFLGKAKFSP